MMIQFVVKHWEWITGIFVVFSAIGWLAAAMMDVDMDRYTATDAAVDRAYIEKQIEMLRDEGVKK